MASRQHDRRMCGWNTFSDLSDPLEVDLSADELRVEGDLDVETNTIAAAKIISWAGEYVALAIEHLDGRESIIEEPGDAGYISNAGVVYSDIFATMLDAGVELTPFEVAYETYGELNAARSNAILICHALSGDQYVIGTHPATGCTIALTSSPNSASGTPITATSCTDGCAASTDSISAG